MAFNPLGVAARAFVEGIYLAKDKTLVDHCTFMWNTDFQWGYMGCFPIMKGFLEKIDLPYDFETLDQEEKKKELEWVYLQRKLLAVMQATNRLSARAFNEPLGLFYHIDGKILMSSGNPESLFDRPPRWKFDEYRLT